MCVKLKTFLVFFILFIQYQCKFQTEYNFSSAQQQTFYFTMFSNTSTLYNITLRLEAGNSLSRVSIASSFIILYYSSLDWRRQQLFKTLLMIYYYMYLLSILKTKQKEESKERLCEIVRYLNHKMKAWRQGSLVRQNSISIHYYYTVYNYRSLSLSPYSHSLVSVLFPVMI